MKTKTQSLRRSRTKQLRIRKISCTPFVRRRARLARDAPHCTLPSASSGQRNSRSGSCSQDCKKIGQRLQHEGVFNTNTLWVQHEVKPTKVGSGFGICAMLWEGATLHLRQLMPRNRGLPKENSGCAIHRRVGSRIQTTNSTSDNCSIERMRSRDHTPRRRTQWRGCHKRDEAQTGGAKANLIAVILWSLIEQGKQVLQIAERRFVNCVAAFEFMPEIGYQYESGHIERKDLPPPHGPRH